MRLSKSMLKMSLVELVKPEDSKRIMILPDIRDLKTEKIVR